MTTFDTGRKAESTAAEYLKKLGFKIIEQNWRTRQCEIDIVAEKSKTVYFVEVKYRVSNAHGSGIEYITPRKLEQMGFAAEVWVGDHDWTGDYQLAGIEVGGSDFEISNFIESI